MKYKIGDNVTVNFSPGTAEYYHGNKQAIWPFDGKIIDIIADQYLVEDQDGDIFSVSKQELTIQPE